MSKIKLLLISFAVCGICFAYTNGDLVAAQTNYQNSIQELNDANEAMAQTSQALVAQNKQLANTQKNIIMLKQQASATEAKIKTQELKVKEAKSKINNIWSSIQQQ